MPHIEEKPSELVESIPLTKRIERVVQAYFTELEKRLDKKFEDKMAQLVKQKENEMEDALRKSFGLDEDPVVHASDLQKFVRKMQVETAQPGKKTPGSPGATGPEGNAQDLRTPQSKEIDDLFKAVGGKAK